MPRGWACVQAVIGSIIKEKGAARLTLGGNRLTAGTFHLNVASVVSQKHLSDQWEPS
jgi:hypothetical protein